MGAFVGVGVGVGVVFLTFFFPLSLTHTHTHMHTHTGCQCWVGGSGYDRHSTGLHLQVYTCILSTSVLTISATSENFSLISLQVGGWFL